MKLLVSKSVYWMNMNADIENTIKQCATCLEYQQTPSWDKAVPHVVSYKQWDVAETDIFLLQIKHFSAL